MTDTDSPSVPLYIQVSAAKPINSVVVSAPTVHACAGAEDSATKLEVGLKVSNSCGGVYNPSDHLSKNDRITAPCCTLLQKDSGKKRWQKEATEATRKVTKMKGIELLLPTSLCGTLI